LGLVAASLGNGEAEPCYKVPDLGMADVYDYSNYFVFQA
jgi:hypothetical protein